MGAGSGRLWGWWPAPGLWITRMLPPMARYFRSTTAMFSSRGTTPSASPTTASTGMRALASGASLLTGLSFPLRASCSVAP